jgi:hypothetical protein
MDRDTAFLLFAASGVALTIGFILGCIVSDMDRKWRIGLYGYDPYGFKGGKKNREWQELFLEVYRKDEKEIRDDERRA